MKIFSWTLPPVLASSSERVLKVTGCMIALFLSHKYILSQWPLVQDVRKNQKIREEHAKRRADRREQREKEMQEMRTAYLIEEDKDASLSSGSSTSTLTFYEDICKLNVKQLQDMVARRELLAVDVLKACMWKTIQIHDEFNCVTEFLPDALGKAKELDEMYMMKGPLHGIPFCVKEDTKIKGYDVSLGCSARLFQPATETAVIVQCLEKLGAVPFCRTNLPQTCVSFGSSNPIFGSTANPLNKKLIAGGSSSGTACLVAAGGCPFGTGSDTGGSLRVPSHFCGLSTLKATSNRLSRRGCSHCVDKLPAVPGLITRTAVDQAFIFQTLIDQKMQNKMDGSTVPLPWNTQVMESRQKLKVGYISQLEEFPALGDSGQLMQRVKVYLESMGHICVPFELPIAATAFINLKIDSDMEGRFKSLLEFDEISDSINYRGALQDSPGSSRSFCLRNLCFSNNKSSNKPYEEDVRLVKEELVQKFLDQMSKQEVDLLVCLVMPFPATSIQGGELFERAVAYTIMWSWLDFPAGVVKFWKESGLHWESSVEALGSTISPDLKSTLLQDGEACERMPIGIQVVGRPYHEELVLRTMVELDLENDETLQDIGTPRKELIVLD